MGSFIVLPNQVFPCFHCFSKLLHHTYLEYAIKFFFVDRTIGMLLNCHMCQFPFLDRKQSKNKLIKKKKWVLLIKDWCEKSS